MWFYKTATVRRLNSTSGDYADHHTIKIFFQPSALELREADDMFSKRFVGYVDRDVDIQETDRIVINNKTYKVAGVSTYDYGRLMHKEVILEKLFDT